MGADYLGLQCFRRISFPCVPCRDCFLIFLEIPLSADCNGRLHRAVVGEPRNGRSAKTQGSHSRTAPCPHRVYRSRRLRPADGIQTAAALYELLAHRLREESRGLGHMVRKQVSRVRILPVRLCATASRSNAMQCNHGAHTPHCFPLPLKEKRLICVAARATCPPTTTHGHSNPSWTGAPCMHLPRKSSPTSTTLRASTGSTGTSRRGTRSPAPTGTSKRVATMCRSRTSSLARPSSTTATS